MELIHAMQDRINRFERRLEQARLALEQQNPAVRLQMARSRLVSLKKRLVSSIQQLLTHKEFQLEQQKVLLAAVSPKNTLARGYAIMLDEKGRIIRASNQVQVGDKATVLLHSGRVQVRVEDMQDSEKI
jgi:exodeoxyribonuclease VII large subunit